MLYIHHIASVSALKHFEKEGEFIAPKIISKKLHAIEPAFEGIPNGVLRRMGKAVKLSVGAALPLIRQYPDINGIIIGTANGGMEDSIKFMNQIVDYEEGLLAPGNFVQSTPNGLASQIAFVVKNKNYNITHVHRGLAFEHALLDAIMFVNERPQSSVIVGGADEISTYNFNIDSLAGWHKDSDVEAENLYATRSPGSIAGEGAAMFFANGNKNGAIAGITALQTLHSTNEQEVSEFLINFLKKHNSEGKPIDLFLSGENGDQRLTPYYAACENVIEKETMKVRYKHVCGEYPTASSFALWLVCTVIKNQNIPDYFIKQKGRSEYIHTVLLYNTFQGNQHSFILVQSAK